MKKRFPVYFVLLFSLIGLINIANAQDASTWMPDAQLRTVVRSALYLDADEPLTQDAMRNLTWLYVPQRDITNLTGLEHATNLVTLIIFRNQIVDIQPIGKLRKLIFLYVVNNPITDISPLDQLTRLRFLALMQNQISDVSALENSVELQWLYLAGNPITDTSPLMNLPKLSNTDLEIPSIITDPSLRAAVREALGIPANMRLTPQAMQQLTHLIAANLGITSLAGLEYAVNLKSLSIENNQVNDLTPIANLEHLTALYAGSNLISDIQPLAKLDQITQLELQQNQILDISPLANLMNLEVVKLAENPIVDISPIEHLLNSIDIDIKMPDPVQTPEDTPQTETKVDEDKTSVENTPQPEVVENTAPVFTEGSSASRSIDENTISGVNIGSAVSATDVDNDSLTYTLGGTDASSFTIDSSTGQLLTSAALDYEITSSYSVIITVSDGTYTDTISVTITVIDINEIPTNNPPVFTEGSSASRSIAENTISGVNIGNPVSATDVDNDSLTYTLGGTDASSFTIDSSTGQLLTSAALDYETTSSYSVIITVSDGTYTNTISVTITVIDINEVQIPTNNPPVFTEGSTASRSIAENTISGVNIGNPVSATDTENDTLTYTLGGTDASSFTIDSTTGQLLTSATLDYEIKSTYTVILSVSDGNGGSDSITVTINITDVAEIDPPLRDRTQQVQDAIVAAVPNVSSAAEVTPAHLAAITTLDISSRSITTLKSGDFDGLSSLTQLRLLDNDLSSLPEDVFDGLSALTELSLSGNSLSSLPEDVFDGLSALTILSLRENSLSTVPGDLFDGLSSLTTLDLTENSLSTVPGDLFDGLSSLTALGLAENSLSSLPEDLFDGLSALSIIGMSGNSLSSLPADVFDGLSAVTKLSMFSNSLSSLPEDVFDGLSSMTDLYLNDNSLSSLPADIFDGLSSLKWLSLHDNSLSSLPADVFDGLSLLELLYLDNNSITDVSELEELTTLKWLKLAGNPISDYGPLRRLIAAIRAAGRSLRIDITIPAAAPAHAAVPTKTALQANYPNPSNPETWIPYQLAKPADVALTIYNMRGVVVRELKLGLQPAGIYQSRSRAIHWDGRNQFGEKVATGVYFYTLKAGDYTATRRMLILK